jgi:hypothetical protein
LFETLKGRPDVLVVPYPFCGRLEVDLAGVKQFHPVAAIEQVGALHTVAILVEYVFNHANAVELCYVVSEPWIAARNCECFTLALEHTSSTVSGLAWRNLWTTPKQFVGSIIDRKHIGVNPGTNLAV